jgi:hypothetical protein
MADSNNPLTPVTISQENIEKQISIFRSHLQKYIQSDNKSSFDTTKEMALEFIELDTYILFTSTFDTVYNPWQAYLESLKNELESITWPTKHKEEQADVWMLELPRIWFDTQRVSSRK